MEMAIRNVAVKDMLEEGELELCAVLQQKKKYRGWEQQPFYYDWNLVEGPYCQLCYLGQEEDSSDRLPLPGMK